MSDSVYDFLYYDVRRVATFLSQFDSYGHLTAITHEEKAGRAGRKTDVVDGYVAVPAVARVKGTTTTETSKSTNEESAKTYDPTWANVLNFMDKLQSRSLLERDIDAAGIGQFVLCSGALQLADLQIVEKTWKLGSVSKMIRGGAKQPKGSPNPADLLFDLMTVIPHTVQAQLTGDHDVWSTLTHSGLTQNSSDLLLSHGTSIPGTWNMIGILDARPDPLTDLINPPPLDMENPSEMGTKILKLLSPISRNLLGRPVTSFAVTPLIIFREIKARARA